MEKMLGGDMLNWIMDKDPSYLTERDSKFVIYQVIHSYFFKFRTANLTILSLNNNSNFVSSVFILNKFNHILLFARF